ncbi:ankyrin repeat family A protein 2-like isoform X1 [Pomacea canaliculata]|uniref:ankyrin repeat family A protein 2-like isoform X1 n=1 Tax=Pomacea canaliculata TaxID=400727 RepID=UPI000D72EEEF|nr:ankyrin repeat family A protein 2-like isoform X1 [Pomacea canaliculata]
MESVSPDTGKHQEEESFKESGRRHSTSDVPQKGASPPKRGPPPGLRIFSPVDSDDLEVETVLSDGRGSRTLHGALSRSRSTDHFDVTSKINQSPFRPSTVMTNLSRGNVQTTTPSIYPTLTIHQMAAQGEVVILQQELHDGIDINSVDENGLTALHWACANGQLATVEFLVKNGADISLGGNQGETPLLLASCYGFCEIVKFLLTMGIDVNYADESGGTALIYAAYNNHAACITSLLEFGADLTATNEDQLTAFDLSVAQGNRAAQQAIERFMLSTIEGPAPQ